MKKATTLLSLLCFSLLTAHWGCASNKSEDLIQKGRESFKAKKPEEAFKYFKKAADLGDSNAQNMVGICFQRGIGVAGDPQQAFQWYLKSANQQNPRGELSVAQCYENGLGVKESLEESTAWYNKVAATDNESTEKANDGLIRLGVIKKPFEIIDEKDFDLKVLKAKGPVLVEYFATWCGPCHEYGPVMENVAKEYHGRLKVIRVDLDDSPELAKKYNIESIPQTFLFNKGNLLYRWMGYVGIEEVEKNIKDQLNLKKAS